MFGHIFTLLSRELLIGAQILLSLAKKCQSHFSVFHGENSTLNISLNVLL